MHFSVILLYIFVFINLILFLIAHIWLCWLDIEMNIDLVLVRSCLAVIYLSYANI